MEERVQLVIIGSGPAGLTAAIYAARANLDPIVFEGIQPGGQLMITTDIENFPGWPDGVNGPELMENCRKQAERFGSRLIQEEVQEVDLSKRPFSITYGDGKQLLADALIVASGASARWLNIESEQRLRGHGVSACATCDGFFFSDKKVAIIGGGDTAMEEAIHLTRFASEVIVIHRRNELRASPYMQERAMRNKKIKFVWDSIVDEILGDPSTGVTGLRLKNIKTNVMSRLDLDGVFVAIGHTPNTSFLKGQLPVDDSGFIKCGRGDVASCIPGVFVAGDVRDARYRQAITAAGTGAMAAIEAQDFLEMYPVK
ncbi:thioredoxin-disulfide reductase [bacterium]|nr:thioredoxin-disulfide reductase [candidate division CSSED10-310 bacterium]